MRCPKCNVRLILQAFWQGRYVNCTSCGARLERGIVGIVLPMAAALAAFLGAEWLLNDAGVSMEVEIGGSLLALAAAYAIVHVLTLDLRPREEEPRLKLD